MRLFIWLGFLAAFAVQGHRIQTLNDAAHSVRQHHIGLPFFAYFRYGILPDSLVFNINADCHAIEGQVISAFLDFAADVKVYQPAEIRLAWRGETIATLRRTELDLIWAHALHRVNIADNPLAYTTRCTSTNDIIIVPRSLPQRVDVMI